MTWLALVVPWLKEKAGPWLLDHWKDIAVLLVMLLAWLLARKSGQLDGCEEALKASPQAQIQVQAVTATAKTSSRVKITPIQGNPCPKVEIETDGQSGAAVSQSQTASTGHGNAPSNAAGGIWVGGRYLSTPQQAYGLITGEIQQDRLKLDGGLGVGVWEVGASWQAVRW